MNSNEIERLLESGDTTGLLGIDADCIRSLLEHAKSTNLTIARRARLVLGQLKNEKARQALLKIAIYERDNVCMEIIMSAGYKPEDSYDRCLFFLLKDDWDKLRLLDEDYSLVVSEYKRSSSIVKQIVINSCQREINKNTPEAVELLVRIAEELDWSGGDDVFSVLRIITNQTQKNVVCKIWANSKSAKLGEFLANERWFSTETSEIWLLTVLNANLVDEIDFAEESIVDVLLEIATSNQYPSNLTALAAKVLRNLRNETQIDKLCYLAGVEGNGSAQEIARGANYKPRDVRERVVFYLLMGYWKEYEQLDFDQSILEEVYASGSMKLKSQLLAQLKRSGRTEWIRAATGVRETRKLKDLTRPEWEAIVSSAKATECWDDLWTLARVAPTVISMNLVRYLAIAGWEPSIDDECSDFKRLVKLCQDCDNEDSLALNLNSQAVVNSEITSAVFDCIKVKSLGSGKYLLVGGHFTGQVICWTETGEKRVLGNHNHESVTDIALGNDLIASIGLDRCIRMWRVSDYSYLGGFFMTQYERFTGCSAIVIDPATDDIFVGGKDGQIHIIHRPKSDWKIKRSFEKLGGAITCLGISDDGQQIVSGTAEGEIQLISVGTGKVEHRERLSGSKIVATGIYKETIVGIDSDRVYNVSLCGEERNRIELGNTITSASIATAANRMVVGTTHGGIMLMSVFGEKLGTQTCKGRPISVSLDQSGTWFASAHRPRGVYVGSIGSDLPDIFWKPIDLVRIEELSNCPESAWKHILMKLLEIKTKYDIGIEERATSIACGDFDIELE